MDRLLSEKDVVSLLGISRTTIWRKVRSGDFPPPRAVTAGRKGYLASEIAEWIAQRPVAQQYLGCNYQQEAVDCGE